MTYNKKSAIKQLDDYKGKTEELDDKRIEAFKAIIQRPETEQAGLALMPIVDAFYNSVQGPNKMDKALSDDKKIDPEEAIEIVNLFYRIASDLDAGILNCAEQTVEAANAAKKWADNAIYNGKAQTPEEIKDLLDSLKENEDMLEKYIEICAYDEIEKHKEKVQKYEAVGTPEEIEAQAKKIAKYEEATADADGLKEKIELLEQYQAEKPTIEGLREALALLEQYKTLGTVEEFQEFLDAANSMRKLRDKIADLQKPKLRDISRLEKLLKEGAPKK